jgi:hypothetical protein
MNVNLPPEAIWAAIGFVFVKVFDWLMGFKKKDDELKDETFKKLEVSLDENSQEMMRLRFSIESLEKTVAPLPKMEKDINEAHMKIREIKAVMDFTDKES